MKTTIPVREMAMAMLPEMFPHLDPAQIVSLRTGTPMPPSGDWQASGLVLPDTNDVPIRGGRPQDLGDALAAAARQAELLRRLGGSLIVGDWPLISGILVFGIKARLRRARKAVQQFVDQTYPNKQLVIVNDTDVSVTTVPCREVKELQYVASSENGWSRSLGAMRNFGISEADGDYLYTHWDDDDAYDPHLLTYTAVAGRPAMDSGVALACSHQLRVDIDGAQAYVHEDVGGIPNTMLVPRPKKGCWYEDWTGAEDVAFWHRYWAAKALVLDTGSWPLDTLKTCVYDGHNVAPATEFMRDHSSPDKTGTFDLPPAEIDYLKAALASFGVITEVKGPR